MLTILLLVPAVYSLLTDPEESGCPSLPTYQQDTKSTVAAVIKFTPEIKDGVMKTDFTCEPTPGTNMTIITAETKWFGGDKIQYVSPANRQWSLSLKCNAEEKIWVWEQLVEDIMYYVRFYKIRCNAFLLTDVHEIDRIGEELESLPFP